MKINSSTHQNQYWRDYLPLPKLICDVWINIFSKHLLNSRLEILAFRLFLHHLLHSAMLKLVYTAPYGSLICYNIWMFCGSVMATNIKSTCYCFVNSVGSAESDKGAEEDDRRAEVPAGSDSGRRADQAAEINSAAGLSVRSVLSSLSVLIILSILSVLSVPSALSVLFVTYAVRTIYTIYHIYIFILCVLSVLSVYFIQCILSVLSV